eukprot:1831031-Pyramimonas_sp.AAC.1
MSISRGGAGGVLELSCAVTGLFFLPFWGAVGPYWGSLNLPGNTVGSCWVVFGRCRGVWSRSNLSQGRLVVALLTRSGPLG